MPQNFLPCDRDQELLLPPSLRGGCRTTTWLGSCSTPWRSWTSSRSMRPIAAMAGARRAHDPEMMVALLVYAYAIGRCRFRVKR